MLDIIYVLLGLILCTSIVIYFVKKKRRHKDFYLVVITTTLFGLLCLILVIWETEDLIAIQNKNFKKASGQCVVTEFKTSGKTRLHELEVEINNKIYISGDFDDFKDVKQGTYACTVKYIEKSRTLYDIKSQSTNK